MRSFLAGFFSVLINRPAGGVRGGGQGSGWLAGRLAGWKDFIREYKDALLSKHQTIRLPAEPIRGGPWRVLTDLMMKKIQWCDVKKEGFHEKLKQKSQTRMGRSRFPVDL